MILPFKEQFVQPINEGIKIHTIREDLHNRWHPGIKMHMATGVRTKHYHCFNDKHKCVSTQKITINIIRFGCEMRIAFVVIDGRQLLFDEVVTLAKNDGFANLDQFKDWFIGGFDGKLIHWTPFKY